MKISKTEVVNVNAKTLHLHLKVCDQFYANLISDNGRILKEYEGYVPEFMPGSHYGDYVLLNIDIDTGQIINWKTPRAEQIETFIQGEK